MRPQPITRDNTIPSGYVAMNTHLHVHGVSSRDRPESNAQNGDKREDKEQALHESRGWSRKDNAASKVLVRMALILHVSVKMSTSTRLWQPAPPVRRRACTALPSLQCARNWHPRYWPPRKYSFDGIRFCGQANHPRSQGRSPLQSRLFHSSPNLILRTF
jgi:hypothetical protein